MRERLRGWGGTSPSGAELVETGDLDALRAVLAAGDARGVLARGLARSYGDAAQNGGGRVVRWLEDSIGPVSPTGEVRLGAGTSLARLIRVVAPQGWIPAVLPGTANVTVGGAIACDVHGKDHRGAGSFGSWVVSLELLDGGGSLRTLSPAREPDAFWATVGGMGLTGIVVSATVRLVALPSTQMTVRTRRHEALAPLLADLADPDPDLPHQAAWVDTLASGAHLGRGIVTSAGYAPASAVRGDPLALPVRRTLTAPPRAPGRLLGRPAAVAFNEAWFRRAGAGGTAIRPMGAVLHPLDAIDRWNRLYGAAGFVQHQFVVGDPAAVRAALRVLSDRRVPSLLAVLKRLGPGNAAPLSFPAAGWTLAVDIPSQWRGLRALLHDLDQITADGGGRVYLAKDSRLGADDLAAQYPRLGEWQQVRDRLDPTGLFRSDLGRRLRLVTDGRPQAARGLADVAA